MSKRSCNVHRWKCDFCGYEEVGREKMPAGWKRGTLVMTDCGLTGYTAREPADVCPKCPDTKTV